MKLFYTLLTASTLALLTSCGGSEEATSEEGTEENQEATSHDDTQETDETSSTEPFSSDLKNEITIIKYDDTTQAFNQTYVYANFSKLYESYRIIFLNYDKSLDSDYGDRTGDQQKVVVGLFMPKDGEFKPGKYTWNGDADGMNRITGQVQTAEGLKGCNYAGFDEEGYIDVIHVTDEEIVGTFHLLGQGFELKGSFNTKHEDVN